MTSTPGVAAALLPVRTLLSEGIWRWANLFEPTVPEPHRLTLGEGHTPLVSLPMLASRMGIGALLLKRDDLSPGGSHKSRSLAYRISLALARGERACVISSSGNAAAAASLYCARAAGQRDEASGDPWPCPQLVAFVSPDTPPVKLSALAREGTIVIRSAKPRNLARYAARVFGLSNLTPSFDDLSIEGFKSIACELHMEVPDADHFFSFVTSGSSFIGVARMARTLGWSPSLHAVGAGAAARLAGALDPRFSSEPPPPSRLAGLLGIDRSPRAEEAGDHMRRTGGRGWVQSDDEIRVWHAALRDAGVDTSAEGAACVAAVARARREGIILDGCSVVVLLTGHASQWNEAAARETSDKSSDGSRAAADSYHINSYVDLRRLLTRLVGPSP